MDTTTGSTVTSGAYTSGGTINFDGLDVVVTGTVAAGDVFTLSAHKGAAQRFGLAISDTDTFAAASTSATIPGAIKMPLSLVNLHTSSE